MAYYTPNNNFGIPTLDLNEFGLTQPQENMQVAEAINYNTLPGAKDKFTPDFDFIERSNTDVKNYKGTTKGDYINAVINGQLGNTGGGTSFDRNVGDLFKGVNLDAKGYNPFSNVTPTFQYLGDGTGRGNLDIDKGALSDDALQSLPKGFFLNVGDQSSLIGPGGNPMTAMAIDPNRMTDAGYMGFGLNNTGRNFDRNFSQLGDVDSFRSRMERMEGTRQPSSFRSLNNPEVYGELEKQGILESLLSKGKELGKGIISKAGGIGDFASNFGIMGMLSKMDNFKNLSQADQQFILGQAGGNRPAKDKYGYNIRSAFGNYGQLVKDRAKLADFRKQIGKPIRAIDKYYLKKENQRKAELQKQIQESIQRESGADSYTNRAMAHESKVGRNSGERMGRI